MQCKYVLEKTLGVSPVTTDTAPIPTVGTWVRPPCGPVVNSAGDFTARLAWSGSGLGGVISSAVRVTVHLPICVKNMIKYA
ncbi:hypothetical protein HanPI659440_Chr13g0488231 [Helianthus annuus]|nr:hypothetical protein HanPI659440_Chr13g0488231 [Helianthus annuus]